MKVVITGTRDTESALRLRPVIQGALRSLPPGSIVITGDALGVDLLAKKEAEKMGIKVVSEKADWKRLRLAAGPVRNGKMLDHNPDEVWYFHPALPQSKGTKDCVQQARRRGIPTQGFFVDPNKER